MWRSYQGQGLGPQNPSLDRRRDNRQDWKKGDQVPVPKELNIDEFGDMDSEDEDGRGAERYSPLPFGFLRDDDVVKDDGNLFSPSKSRCSVQSSPDKYGRSPPPRCRLEPWAVNSSKPAIDLPRNSSSTTRDDQGTMRRGHPPTMRPAYQGSTRRNDEALTGRNNQQATRRDGQLHPPTPKCEPWSSQSSKHESALSRKFSGATQNDKPTLRRDNRTEARKEERSSTRQEERATSRRNERASPHRSKVWASVISNHSVEQSRNKTVMPQNDQPSLLGVKKTHQDHSIYHQLQAIPSKRSSRKDSCSIKDSPNTFTSQKNVYAEMANTSLGPQNDLHTSSSSLSNKQQQNIAVFTSKQAPMTSSNLECTDLQLMQAQLLAASQLLGINPYGITPQVTSSSALPSTNFGLNLSSQSDSLITSNTGFMHGSACSTNQSLGTIPPFHPEVGVINTSVPPPATFNQTRNPVPDGSGSHRYPPPDVNSFTFDPAVGLKFDHTTGLHFEANSGYYLNSNLKIFLRWDAFTQTYLQVENTVGLQIPQVLLQNSSNLSGSFPCNSHTNFTPSNLMPDTPTPGYINPLQHPQPSHSIGLKNSAPTQGSGAYSQQNLPPIHNNLAQPLQGPLFSSQSGLTGAQQPSFSSQSNLNGVSQHPPTPLFSVQNYSNSTAQPFLKSLLPGQNTLKGNLEEQPCAPTFSQSSFVRQLTQVPIVQDNNLGRTAAPTSGGARQDNFNLLNRNQQIAPQVLSIKEILEKRTEQRTKEVAEKHEPNNDHKKREEMNRNVKDVGYRQREAGACRNKIDERNTVGKLNSSTQRRPIQSPTRRQSKSPRSNTSQSMRGNSPRTAQNRSPMHKLRGSPEERSGRVYARTHPRSADLRQGRSPPKRLVRSPTNRLNRSPDSIRDRGSTHREGRSLTSRHVRRSGNRQGQSPDNRQGRNSPSKCDRSPIDRQERSPVWRRGRNPINRQGQNSPPKSDRSPIDRQRKSPVRRHGRSPTNRQGRNSPCKSDRSPIDRQGRSPVRRHGRSPIIRQRQNSPCKSGKSPIDRKGKSPVRRHGRSPIIRQRQNSPCKSDRSPTDRQGRSPARRRGRSPINRQRQNSLHKSDRSPIDRQGRSPVNRKGRNLTDRQGSSPTNRGIKSLVNRREKSPLRRQERSSVHRQGRSLVGDNLSPHEDCREPLNLPIKKQEAQSKQIGDKRPIDLQCRSISPQGRKTSPYRISHQSNASDDISIPERGYSATTEEDSTILGGKTDALKSKILNNSRHKQRPMMDEDSRNDKSAPQLQKPSNDNLIEEERARRNTRLVSERKFVPNNLDAQSSSTFNETNESHRKNLINQQRQSDQVRLSNQNKSEEGCDALDLNPDAVPLNVIVVDEYCVTSDDEDMDCILVEDSNEISAITEPDNIGISRDVVADIIPNISDGNVELAEKQSSFSKNDSTEQKENICILDDQAQDGNQAIEIQQDTSDAGGESVGIGKEEALRRDTGIVPRGDWREDDPINEELDYDETMSIEEAPSHKDDEEDEWTVLDEIEGIIGQNTPDFDEAVEVDEVSAISEGLTGTETGEDNLNVKCSQATSHIDSKAMQEGNLAGTTPAVQSVDGECQSDSGIDGGNANLQVEKNIVAKDLTASKSVELEDCNSPPETMIDAIKKDSSPNTSIEAKNPSTSPDMPTPGGRDGTIAAAESTNISSSSIVAESDATDVHNSAPRSSEKPRVDHLNKEELNEKPSPDERVLTVEEIERLDKLNALTNKESQILPACSTSRSCGVLTRLGTQADDPSKTKWCRSADVFKDEPRFANMFRESPPSHVIILAPIRKPDGAKKNENWNPQFCKALRKRLEGDLELLEKNVQSYCSYGTGAPYDYALLTFKSVEMAQQWYAANKDVATSVVKIVIPVHIRPGIPNTTASFGYYSQPNWSCSNCRLSNFPIRSLCYKCGTHRDGGISPVLAVDHPTRWVGLFKLPFGATKDFVLTKFPAKVRSNYQNLNMIIDPEMDSYCGICVFQLENVRKAQEFQDNSPTFFRQVSFVMMNKDLECVKRRSPVRHVKGAVKRQLSPDQATSSEHQKLAKRRFWQTRTVKQNESALESLPGQKRHPKRVQLSSQNRQSVDVRVSPWSNSIPPQQQSVWQVSAGPSLEHHLSKQNEKLQNWSQRLMYDDSNIEHVPPRQTSFFDDTYSEYSSDPEQDVLERSCTSDYLSLSPDNSQYSRVTARHQYLKSPEPRQYSRSPHRERYSRSPDQGRYSRSSEQQQYHSRSDGRPRKPDGNQRYRYPPPDHSQFLYERHSKMDYDPETTLYYDRKLGLYYNDDLKIYLKYDEKTGRFTDVFL